MTLRTTTPLLIFLLGFLNGNTQALAERPIWKSFRQMHAAYTSAFERSPGFGVSRMVRPPMRQTSVVASDESTTPTFAARLLVQGQPFTVTKQNLIGLSREKPVVFQSDEVGMMQSDRIEAYAKRDLTSFEEQAVETLRDDKFVTYQANDDATQYTVVGALRAKQSCIQCHDVAVDTLLGAFVYTLDRGAIASPELSELQQQVPNVERQASRHK